MRLCPRPASTPEWSGFRQNICTCVMRASPVCVDGSNEFCFSEGGRGSLQTSASASVLSTRAWRRDTKAGTGGLCEYIEASASSFLALLSLSPHLLLTSTPTLPAFHLTQMGGDIHTHFTPNNRQVSATSESPGSHLPGQVFVSSLGPWPARFNEERSSVLTTCRPGGSHTRREMCGDRLGIGDIWSRVRKGPPYTVVPHIGDGLFCPDHRPVPFPTPPRGLPSLHSPHTSDAYQSSIFPSHACVSSYSPNRMYKKNQE